MDGYNSISRKKALDMSELVAMYIKQMKLGAGLNTRRIFAAWDEVSGASGYTIRKYFRDGKLYVTLNSSMARMQLSYQLEIMAEKINQMLAEDDLFVKDDPDVKFVKEIVLK